MDRETIVDALVDCEECPYGREELEGMSPEGLAFAANAAPIDFDSEEDDEGGDADPSGTEPASNASGDDEGEEPPAWATNLLDRVEEMGERLESVEEATRDVRADREERRERLVDGLVDNSSFSRDELESMDLEVLEKLDRETAPTDFAGRGGPSRMAASRADGGDEDLGFDVQGVLQDSPGE